MANTLIVPPAIVLCTLNAKYIHASLGLRYLLANMGELRPQTALREYTIARRPPELAEELLALVDLHDTTANDMDRAVCLYCKSPHADVCRKQKGPLAKDSCTRDFGGIYVREFSNNKKSQP